MIKLTHLRTLNLAAVAGNHSAYLSAASGLVKVREWLCVVADDEKFMGVFSTDVSKGTLLRLTPGDLPSDPLLRKAAKHDFEVLTLLPPSKKSPHGALLVLGSGSAKNRKLGVIVQLCPAPELFGEIECVDLSLVYKTLKNEPGKLNIEGAVVVADDIILFQRGNKNNRNASIKIKLTDFYRAINADQKNLSFDYRLTPYDLGAIDSIPLCFTDAAPLPDGTIVFTAAAENTTDAYLDGACLGSVIGIIAKNGKLHSIMPVNLCVKLEGIEVNVIDDKLHVLLVTDPDNPALPADMFSAVISGYPFND